MKIDSKIVGFPSFFLELLNMEKKISILREMNEQILEHWRETDELLDEKDKEINKLREENEKFKKDSNSTDQGLLIIIF